MALARLLLDRLEEPQAAVDELQIVVDLVPLGPSGPAAEAVKVLEQTLADDLDRGAAHLGVDRGAGHINRLWCGSPEILQDSIEIFGGEAAENGGHLGHGEAFEEL